MRAWQFAATTGNWPLQQVMRPEPEPGPGDVVIHVRAVALNYRDLVVARGGYQGRVPTGAVPCSDAAGEVVAVGRDVRDVRVGDRVTSSFVPDWVGEELTRSALRTTPGGGLAPGMLAERIVLPSAAVVPMPSDLTFEEAATLPCAGLTAWHALFETVAPCSAGTTVLTMGTGGVSTFAAQFALAAGATVIASSGHASKIARLRSLGVASTLNYRETPAWGEAVRSLSPGEEGVDLVIEVGGQGTLEQSMRAVRPGGTIALIGTLAGPSPISLTPLFLRNIRLQGVLAGSRRMSLRMNDQLTRWAIRPVIDRVFHFDDVPAAYDYLASGAHVGKVVVRVGEAGARGGA